MAEAARTATSDVVMGTSLTPVRASAAICAVVLLLLPAHPVSGQLPETGHAFLAQAQPLESDGLASARDSLALVALYQATGGPDWKKRRGWLQGSLTAGEWDLVTISRGRVVGLDLAGNNLTGTLPPEIGDLTALRNLSLDQNELEGAVPASITRLASLEALFLAKNRLTSLPDLSPLKKLVLVDVFSNRLTFEDLEQNLDLPCVFGYTGQDKIGEPTFRSVDAGDTVELWVPAAGRKNRYQWYKDGVPLGSATGHGLLISSVKQADAGSYVLHVTNDAISDLTLKSHPIIVSVGGLPTADNHNLSPAVASLQSGRFRLIGGVRIRADMDRGTSAADGTRVPNRDRLGLRVRLGFEYDYNRSISIGGGLRSGSRDAIQSPDITFGDELGLKSFAIDKVFIRGTWNGGTAWIGKNDFPFWAQNGLLWDEDITPEGIAAKHHVQIKPSTSATATAGYFILQPSANSTFTELTRLAGLQFALSSEVGMAVVETATAYFDFSHNYDIEESRLGDLDYRIGTFSVRATTNSWTYPLSVGADIYHNFEKYPSRVFNGDQNTGWSVCAMVGKSEVAGDWLITYTYAHVEKYAVAAGYAQDDWVRWGTSSITRSSNFKGHEIRAGISLGPLNDIGFRLYLVDGIAMESPSAVERESGVRVRLDWTIGF